MITPAKIAELRSRTGLGVLECRNALREANGEVETAIQKLQGHSRTAIVDRGHREAREGVVGSYIHIGGKIGAIVEVNCETDFVARNEEFKKFANELALHVVAAAPKWVSDDDIPQDILIDEMCIARAYTTENNLDLIAAGQYIKGRMDVFFNTTCLLRQPFVRDTDVTIGEMITNLSNKFKEKIVVRRFHRVHVGQ